LDGVLNGFRIIDEGAEIPFNNVCNNYGSATCAENRDAVERLLLGEISEGRYCRVCYRPNIVSALGTVPKKDSHDLRLIHDCSQPSGYALNDLCNPDSCRFQTLDDAVSMLKPGWFMAKVDLKNAYRAVGIHPSNFAATGLHWHFKGDEQPTFLIDKRLPFGARNSPLIFHRLTQAVRRMMSRKGYSGIVVYLDDFFIAASSKSECLHIRNVLLRLLRKLGFHINWNKVEGPSTQLKFLGILINTVTGVLCLAADRLNELRELARQFLLKRRATRKQLQALAGKLNWACQVVRGGRIYLRRIFDSISKLKKPNHKIKLPAALKEDLLWWFRFLKNFNGKAAFPEQKPTTDVFVDACNNGAGAFFRGDWVYCNWETDWPGAAALHINYKEALTIVLAARRWAPAWKNKRVIIQTDSQVARAIINKGSCHNKIVMCAIRELFWSSVHFNFTLHCVYVEGSKNELADAVSRLHELRQWPRLGSLLCAWSAQCNLTPPTYWLPNHISPKTLNLLRRCQTTTK